MRRRRAGPEATGRYAAVASYRLAPGAPADERAPTAVLMLHGLGGDSGQLWPYAGGDPARRRLAPDLRAHGATMLIGGRGCFTFGGLTRDLAALLDRLRFPPAVVVGMSMGAGVAARLALHQPLRVRGLVLIRPAWLDVRPPAGLLPLIQAGRLLQRYGARAGRARFVESDGYGRVLERSPAAAASLVAQFDAPHAVERSVRLTRMPRSAPLRHVRDLRRISVPAVVVGAPADPQHPFEIARIWASALMGSHLVAAPARDADPAGYQACLTRACADLAGQVDATRPLAHDA
ncbi:MAG TPA: alpha/beta hydrolase [Streptosporangiaceae bacterium]|nr:alpha/beta hydrolase [Streptosporangiaceae bacterium]